MIISALTHHNTASLSTSACFPLPTHFHTVCLFLSISLLSVTLPLSPLFAPTVHHFSKSTDLFEWRVFHSYYRIIHSFIESIHEFIELQTKCCCLSIKSVLCLVCHLIASLFLSVFGPKWLFGSVNWETSLRVRYSFPEHNIYGPKINYYITCWLSCLMPVPYACICVVYACANVDSKLILICVHQIYENISKRGDHKK